MKAEIATIEGTLNPFLESGAKLVTEVELAKAEKDLKKWHAEWKKKKRATGDVCGQLSESMDMNKKTMMEKAEIETDEDHNVVCPL